jgi:anti-sigma B factor antagonist
MRQHAPTHCPPEPAPPSAHLRTGTSANPAVVDVAGEIDAATAPHLSAILEQLPTSTDLVVDLSGVDFMGAAGVTLLLRLRRRLLDDGSTLQLTGATPVIRRVIDVLHLAELLPYLPADPVATNAPRPPRIHLTSLRRHVPAAS